MTGSPAAHHSGQAVFRAARIETAKPQLRDGGVLTFGSGAVVAIAMERTARDLTPPRHRPKSSASAASGNNAGE